METVLPLQLRDIADIQVNCHYAWGGFLADNADSNI